ncbi:MAG TPA: hypothetical protein VNR87_11160 [Flavisolibacter sp.]|nr:hypothetical protein [Flavisolibacter sp.]
MVEQAEETFYARKWPSYIPAVMALLFFIFNSNQRDNSIFFFTMLMLIISLISYFVLSRVSITLTPQGFVHRNIFRTKEVFWSNVSRTFIRYRHHGKSGSYYWYFQDPNENSTRFSVRSFSRTNLQRLAGTVIQRCRAAVDDERIAKMAEGKFPWYFF